VKEVTQLAEDPSYKGHWFKGNSEHLLQHPFYKANEFSEVGSAFFGLHCPMRCRALACDATSISCCLPIRFTVLLYSRRRPLASSHAYTTGLCTYDSSSLKAALLRQMPGPYSSYSALVLHSDANSGIMPRTLPPNHTAYRCMACDATCTSTAFPPGTCTISHPLLMMQEDASLDASPQ